MADWGGAMSPICTAGPTVSASNERAAVPLVRANQAVTPLVTSLTHVKERSQVK